MEPVALAKASAGGGGGGNLVLILDYGSQYTHLIARRIRQLSVFSLCISGTSSLSSIAELNPRVVILSGGPHSVHVDGAPSFPDGFLRYAEENGVHVLGICYGMQLIVQKLGGQVAVGEKQEYGKMEITVEKECGIYGPEAVCGTQTVWMSHGDEVVKLPEGFTVVARSLHGSVAAIENHSRRFFGIQYHPEVILETNSIASSVCIPEVHQIGGRSALNRQSSGDGSGRSCRFDPPGAKTCKKSLRPGRLAGILRRSSQ